MIIPTMLSALLAMMPLNGKQETHPVIERGYSHAQMQNYKKSAYRGKYYHKDQEDWRKCVGHRESRWRYGANNMPVSTAAGAYQFLHAWWDSLPYMIAPELKKMYGNKKGKMIRDELLDLPLYRWNRFYQDMSFFTALNYQHKWSGKKHWVATVPGTSCG